MPKLDDVKLGLMEWVEMVKIGRKVQQHIRNKNEKEKKQAINSTMKIIP
jgi:hypothetical protein